MAERVEHWFNRRYHSGRRDVYLLRTETGCEPPWIFRRENQLRSFLFWEERENGDGEATQVVYGGI
jgi:hypothetical protein